MTLVSPLDVMRPLPEKALRRIPGIFHATTLAACEQIIAEGLKGMTRQGAQAHLYPPWEVELMRGGQQYRGIEPDVVLCYDANRAYTATGRKVLYDPSGSVTLPVTLSSSSVETIVKFKYKKGYRRSDDAYEEFRVVWNRSYISRSLVHGGELAASADTGTPPRFHCQSCQAEISKGWLVCPKCNHIVEYKEKVHESAPPPTTALPARRAAQIVTSDFHTGERSLHAAILKHFSMVFKYQAKWVLDTLETQGDKGVKLRGREAARHLAAKGYWPRYPGQGLVSPWDPDEEAPRSCKTLDAVRSCVSGVCWEVVSAMQRDRSLTSHEQFTPAKLKQELLSTHVIPALETFYNRTLKVQPSLSKQGNVTIDLKSVPTTHQKNIELAMELFNAKKQFEGEGLATLADEHKRVMQMDSSSLERLAKEQSVAKVGCAAAGIVWSRSRIGKRS